ncbi:glycosyltransferase family 2 protein [Rubrivirga sp.]|uniref:glycosyltransferase family 2 protein n=1 Tax=Rubrivirga sp. TaxID=1885344 RepID=UPI003B51ABF4
MSAHTASIEAPLGLKVFPRPRDPQEVGADRRPRPERVDVAPTALGHGDVPVTVLVAAKNEEVNLPRCLSALTPAARVVVLDSRSTDATVAQAASYGAEVVQFDYKGSYPKKRQWALETLDLQTEWVFLLDADEVVPEALWDEIRAVTSDPRASDGYLVTKGFHFLGRAFTFGGFSFDALLLFRTGKARFEHLVDDPASALDMEVHERVIVDGTVKSLKTPLVHEDFKGLEAYIRRHNQYSTWEARLRHSYLNGGSYGTQSVQARLFGNAQERRRFLKKVAIRTPFEPLLWFLYHFILRGGFLEGRAGLIASQIRASYISQVRAKMYELGMDAQAEPGGATSRPGPTPITWSRSTPAVRARPA